MADKNTELIDVLEKGIDYKNRRIYFGNKENEGAFTWASVEDTIRALDKLSEGSKKPINLHMSSTGGDTYQMLRLYDALQKCPCQIRFYGSGEICSSAVWVMSGCDERYLDPNTCIMLHAGYTEGGETTTHTDSQIDNEEYNRLIDKLMIIFEQNSRMPRDFWSEISQRDTYLTPEEAIMLGLADKITEPKKRGNLRKVRSYALRQVPDKRALNKLIKTIYKRIHKGRQLTKIEVHIPQEQFDKNIIVEEEPRNPTYSEIPSLDEKNIIINKKERENTIFIL